MYSLLPSECGVQKFAVASDFLAGLNERLKDGLRVDRLDEGDDDGRYDEDSGEGEGVEEVSENLDVQPQRRTRRTSLTISATGGMGSAGLETAPLTPLLPVKLHSLEDEGARKDGFG